jgi:hypothetical protein
MATLIADGHAISRFTSLSGCLIPVRHTLPPAPPCRGLFFSAFNACRHFGHPSRWRCASSGGPFLGGQAGRRRLAGLLSRPSQQPRTPPPRHSRLVQARKKLQVQLPPISFSTFCTSRICEHLLLTRKLVGLGEQHMDRLAGRRKPAQHLQVQFGQRVATIHDQDQTRQRFTVPQIGGQQDPPIANGFPRVPWQNHSRAGRRSTCRLRSESSSDAAFVPASWRQKPAACDWPEC